MGTPSRRGGGRLSCKHREVDFPTSARYLVVFCLGVLALGTVLPPASAERVLVELKSPSAYRLLGPQPEQGAVIQVRVTWQAAGTLLDSVGIARAERGNVQVRILADGALELSVFAPGDAQADATGWRRVHSKVRLARGQPSVVTVVLGPAAAIFVDRAEQGRIPAPALWPLQNLYLGDFPGDARLAPGTGSHQGMVGTIELSHWGPGPADTQAQTLLNRLRVLAKEQPGEARRLAGMVTTLDVRSANGLGSRGLAHEALGELREAIRDFEASLALQEDESLRKRLARLRARVAGGSGGSVREVFTLTPLVAHDLTPEMADRPLPAGDGLRVTLPASVVAEGGRLTVARAQALDPASMGVFETFGLYDISVGEREEFSDDLVLECRYDPARLDPAVAPEDQVLAVRWDPARRVWAEEPSTLDPARGVIVTRTRHLCVRAWIYRAKVFAYETVRFLTGSVIRTEHFRFLFDADTVRTSSAARKWKGESSFPPEYAGLWTYDNRAWIPLVRDMAYYLERAYAEYDGKHLTPVAAIPIRVDIGPGKASGDVAQYEHQSHTLLVSSDKIAGTAKNLQYVLAHELFHSIQNKDWGGNAAKIQSKDHAWWIEATADYAACRVASHIEEMGGGPLNVFPYLLTGTLTNYGRPAPVNGTSPVGDIEYDKAYFVDYLVRRGLDFLGLYKGVMGGSKGSDTPLDALERYLVANGPAPLPAMFREYAAWFFFDDDSPLGQRPHPMDPRRSAVNPQHKPASAEPVTVPLEQEFFLPAPFSARTWAVRVPQGASAEPTRVTVGATTLDAWAAVDVYTLPDGKRGSSPARRGELVDAGKSICVDLEPGHTLYVAAINLDRVRPANVAVEVRLLRIDDVRESPVGASAPLQLHGSGFRHPGGPVSLIWSDGRGAEREVPWSPHTDREATLEPPPWMQGGQLRLRTGGGHESLPKPVRTSAEPPLDVTHALLFFQFEGEQDKVVPSLVVDEETNNRYFVPKEVREPLTIDMVAMGFFPIEALRNVPVKVNGRSFSGVAELPGREWKTTFQGTVAPGSTELASLVIRHHRRSHSPRVYNPAEMEMSDGSEHVEDYTITLTRIGGGLVSPGAWVFDREFDLEAALPIQYTVTHTETHARTGAVSEGASWSAKGGRILKGRVHLELVRK